jgi:hypothetical protein
MDEKFIRKLLEYFEYKFIIRLKINLKLQFIGKSIIEIPI